MTLLLVDFAKNHFLQFWELGCRPSLLFTITPMKDWKLQDKKTGTEIIETVLYEIPDACFSRDIDSLTIDEVRENCYHIYLRTYFRQWRSQFGWPRSWLDVNNNFECYVQYYWNKVKKHNVTVAVFNSAPHNGSDIILYYVCKALNIRTVVCTASTFPDAMWMHQDIEDIGIDGIPSDFRAPPIELTENPAPPFYMKGAGRMRFIAFAGGAAKQFSRIGLKILTLSFLWNHRSFQKNFFKLRANYRSFAIHQRAKAIHSTFDPDAQYIYFPLHLQPEQTTDIYGGKYVDQILAIEELARILPEGTVIYVKENPKQTLYMRDPSFFERLIDIPSVRYLSVEVSTFELIKRSKGVATICGTAGWEAIQMGKPVICFGYAWYRGIPGVFEWEKIKHRFADAVFGFQFDRKALQDSVRQRSRYLWPGVLDPNMGVLVKNYDADKSANVGARSILAYLRAIESGKREQPHQNGLAADANIGK
jgi:hypothetical protein